MSLKTYEFLNGATAQVSVEIEKKQRSIHFIGGRVNPFLVRPRYRTADKKEQEALEASAYFNTLVFLMKEEKEAVEETDPVIDPILPEGGEGEILPADYPDVTTVQKAKEALITNHGVKAAALPNKEAVLAKAAELNVTFPKLA